MPTYSYDVVIRSKLDPSDVKSGGQEAVQELTRIERQARQTAKAIAELQKNPGFKKIFDDQAREQIRLLREQEKQAAISARNKEKIDAQAAQNSEKLLQQRILKEKALFEQAARQRERLEAQSARNSERINSQNARAAEQLAFRKTESERRWADRAARDRERSAKAAADAEIRENTRAAKEYEKTLRNQERAQKAFEREREQTRSRRVEQAQTAGGAIQTIGTAATGAFTLPVVAGMAYAIKIGSEYEQSMNMLQAVTNATAEEMKQAGELAIKLGNDLSLPGVSAKDAAEAMTELGKSGMTVTQSMQAVKGTLQLALTEGMDFAKAAEITANALNMFGLEATEAGRVADLFAGAANASSASVLDVAESLKQAGSVFAAAGVPIEDTVALIAELANQGIKGSDAGTSLKTMMQRLQSPTDKAAEAMEKLNVQIYDQQGRMKPMKDIIGQFENSLKGLSQQQKDQALNTIFGSDSVRAANIVFKQGAEGFDKMKEAVMRANAAQDLAAARTKGLAGSWEALTSQLETVGLIIYNRIKEPLTEIVVFVATVISQITDAFTNLPEGVQQAILVFGLLLAAIGPVVTIIGTLIVAIASVVEGIAILGGLATVAPVIAAIGIVIAGLTAGIGLAVGAVYALAEAWQNGFGPIASLVVIGVGLIMTAISPILGLPVLIGAVLVTLYQVWKTNFGGIRDFAISVWNKIVELSQAAMQKILELVNAIGGRLLGWWTQNYPIILGVVTSVNDSIQNAVRNFLASVQSFWDKHGSTILSIVNTIWNTIKTVVMFAVDNLLNVIRLFLQVLNGDWAGAWDTFLLIIKNAVKAVFSAWKWLGDNSLKILKWLVGMIWDYSKQAGEALVSSIWKGIKWLVNAFIELPMTLIKLVPRLVAAGASIGSAIWQGIKETLWGESTETPNIPSVPFDITTVFKTPDFASNAPTSNSKSVLDSLTGGLDKLEQTVGKTDKSFKGLNDSVDDTDKKSKKAKKALQIEDASFEQLLSAMRLGTMQQESGGKINARNRRTGALGLFQVMPDQVPNWTANTAGVGRMTVDQFRKDEQAQILVFNKYMGSYLRQAMAMSGGNKAQAVRMAAAAWYGGPDDFKSYDNPRRFRADEPSFREYTSKVLSRTKSGLKRTRGGGFGNITDQTQVFQEESDRLTKEQRDAQIQSAIDLAKILQTMPDEETMQAYNRLQAEQAQKLGQIQPTLDQTRLEFKGFDAPKKIQEDIESRKLSRRDQRILDSAENLKLVERQKELDERRLYLADEIDARTADYNLSLQESITETQVEFGLLQRRNIAVETSVEFEKQRNAQIREIGDVERDLGVLRAQNANADFVTQRRLLDAKRDQLAIEQDITVLQDKIANVGANAALRYQRAWLDAVREVREANIEAVESQIRSQVKLEAAMVKSNDQIRAKVLDHLASQKTLNESIADGIVNVYEKAATGIEKILDKSIGKIPILGDIAKAGARNLLTKITTGLLDKFLPSEFSDALKSTGNPVLDENKKQTNYLKKISDAVTGKSVTGAISGAGSGGSSGGGIFGMIKQILGLGGNGNYGTPVFNPNASGNFFANNPAGLSPYQGGLRQIWEVPNSGFTRSGGGFGSLFGKGGIFGKEGFGNNVGTYGAIGMGANLIGGLIGGRVGGFISGAGSGLAMGAQIGTMIMPGIGTAIGAVAGAIGGGLLSLLGGDPKRKADKQQNMPALQKGFTEAFAALKALASDKKALFNDPDGVVAQAKELKAQIAAGFNVEFQSKKYRKIAQQQIVQKLAEADVLIKQIEAEAALQRNKRAKMESYAPTFADGGHVSNFITKAFQNNPLGYITGPGTARSDSIWARVSNGEYVLDAQTVKNLGIARLDALRMTKGREAGRIFRSLTFPKIGYADGGAIGSVQSGQSNQISEPSRGNITVNTNVFPNESGARVETEVYEDDRLLERKVENIIYRGGQDGKIYRALDNVKKGK